MTVAMSTYCECKKYGVVLNKTNIKTDSITDADMLYNQKAYVGKFFLEIPSCMSNRVLY